ncbi:MAG: formate dehydrogenase accessory sulfurtransferase FdhD [Thiomonas delicata]|jgi:FdhD protein
MLGSSLARAIFWASERHYQAECELSWQIAEEVAVGILLNDKPIAVMMATPADLEDMAIGFLLAEGYVIRTDPINSTYVVPTDTGICVNVSVRSSALRQRPERVMEGRSGCGLCGLNALTDITMDMPFRKRPELRASSVATALSSLTSHQPMNAANHSVHAAGFADYDGNILCVREDVGRHNALDKLIGALAQQNIDCTIGFAVLTSRCSFELVQKASSADFSGLVTISAPTHLALEMAKRAGLPLATAAVGGVALFPHAA